MASGSAKSIDTAVRNLQEKATPDQISMPTERPNNADFEDMPLREGQDMQFPTGALQNKSKEDELMAAKIALQQQAVGGPQAQVGVTPFGVLTAQDKDFLWLRKKQEAEAKANYEAWLSTNFDMADPVHKQWLRDAIPWYFNERQTQLERNLALQKRIAEIRLHGIRSKEDLLVQYALESGLIDMSTLTNIMEPEKAVLAKNDAARRVRYGRGLLNPRRLVQGNIGFGRLANAERGTGKSAAQLGDAYMLGSTDNGTSYGFSSIGEVTPAQRATAGAWQQFKELSSMFTGQ